MVYAKTNRTGESYCSLTNMFQNVSCSTYLCAIQHNEILVHVITQQFFISVKMYKAKVIYQKMNIWLTAVGYFSTRNTKDSTENVSCAQKCSISKHLIESQKITKTL